MHRIKLIGSSPKRPWAYNTIETVKYEFSETTPRTLNIDEGIMPL